ncbi:hypothetical protein B4U80_06721 [Leptotrombidium deliense]|uniref:Uncharacterized protein n=1 Tax=Leptotrombidium deliense TaxID=299467 RepID=A0A443S8L9_9ACAR|nr:hypothetical protein B4U80_06721 [Leptotrombidium deliense]
MVAGPTSSGKTVFVRKLLQFHDSLINSVVNPKIIWMYGQWQSSYSQAVSGVEIYYNEGLMSKHEIESEKPDVIVIDDLMNELGNKVELANLFTKGSHHQNISVIFIVQNIFHQAKQMRNISVNCHYFVIMKNPRDKSQIYHLARQFSPNNIHYLVEAYEDATKNEYGYIKADFTASTPEKFRLQTDIFPINNIFQPIFYSAK